MCSDMMSISVSSSACIVLRTSGSARPLKLKLADCSAIRTPRIRAIFGVSAARPTTAATGIAAAVSAAVRSSSLRVSMEIPFTSAPRCRACQFGSVIRQRSWNIDIMWYDPHSGPSTDPL